MVALPPGFRLFTHDSIDSTNEEARRLVEGGERGNCVVWAKQQSAGRGRRGRQWVSEAGNVYMSMLIWPDAPLAQAAQLSFAAALAVKDTLEGLVTPDGGSPFFSLKWPNDVLLSGSKVSGILLEGASVAAGGTASADYLIIGIGINLRHHPDNTPYPATDIRAATGRDVDIEQVISDLVGHFDQLYQGWAKDGFQALRFRWLEAAWRLGESIEVHQNDKVLHGILADLDETGALRLRAEDGNEMVIHAGDVYFPQHD